MPINPTWTRDEVILAYDLYLRSGKRSLSKANPGVIALSNYLRRLPWHVGQWRDKRFRNAGAVVGKIQQLKAYEEDGVPYSISLIVKGVALDYREKPQQVHAMAEAIRQGVAAQLDILTADTGDGPTPDEDEQTFREGKARFTLHRRLERNRRAVVTKLANVKSTTGSLTCEICGFDFERAYGEIGQGFAECHHIVPLSEVGEQDTRLSDLALVCANCHRMLHRRTRQGELLTPQQLKSLFRSSPQTAGGRG